MESLLILLGFTVRHTQFREIASLETSKRDSSVIGGRYFKIQ